MPYYQVCAPYGYQHFPAQSANYNAPNELSYVLSLFLQWRNELWFAEQWLYDFCLLVIPDRLRIFALGLNDYSALQHKINQSIRGSESFPFIFLYCWMTLFNCSPLSSYLSDKLQGQRRKVALLSWIFKKYKKDCRFKKKPAKKLKFFCERDSFSAKLRPFCYRFGENHIIIKRLFSLRKIRRQTVSIGLLTVRINATIEFSLTLHLPVLTARRRYWQISRPLSVRCNVFGLSDVSDIEMFITDSCLDVKRMTVTNDKDWPYCRATLSASATWLLWHPSFVLSKILSICLITVLCFFFRF